MKILGILGVVASLIGSNLFALDESSLQTTFPKLAIPYFDSVVDQVMFAKDGIQIHYRYFPSAQPSRGTIAVATSSGEESDQAKPGALRGELYHAYIDVDEFEQASDQIKQKIIDLDGEKARAKELGWRRKKDESYFHFTLPESNLAALTEFLRTFGPVRISKEKHPVVMPPGTIRIILIVKDHSDNANESSP